jgi:hypothetical protein
VLRTGQIQGEGFLVFGVQTKLEPLLLAHLTLKIVKNGLEMKKFWPFKVKGSRTKKNRPPNSTKAGS